MTISISKLKELGKKERLEAIVAEFLKCEEDPLYTLTNYFLVRDPAAGKLVRFKPYPYQVRAIHDFMEYDYNLTMKTRQTGLTTVSELFAAWFMCTHDNMVVNALAFEKKKSIKFLREVRNMLDDARKRAPWLIPGYQEGNNGKESFGLTNGSTIVAEANKPDACRGDVINLLIVDEVAAITWMEEIWSSAGLTLTRANGKCIGISTPKGRSGWYFDQYTDAENLGWNIIDAHWSEHPIYKLGMYQFIANENHPDGGEIKYLDDDWPDLSQKGNSRRYSSKEEYKYILDGRLRSPWYDVESRKLGVNRTRCELDCSFSGSGGEVLDPDVIRAIMLKAKNYSVLNKTVKGAWQSYKEYIAFNPLHTYVLAADVATGDGSDFSAFVVLDEQTKEIAATFKDILNPKVYAKVIAEVGKRYGDALVIVENQQGVTTLLELKDELRYPNLYYSVLKQRDVTKRERKRKIGFWQSEKTKVLGGDKLEEVLISGELVVTGSEIISELETWVWNKSGMRDHAPGKHDDLLMGLTMAMFYLYYVKPKAQVNQEMTKKHFEYARVMTSPRGNIDPSHELFGDILEDVYDNPNVKRREMFKRERDRGDNRTTVFEQL